MVVPKTIEDDAVSKVAAFRQGGRFPVLSYYHQKNGMVCIGPVGMGGLGKGGHLSGAKEGQ